MPDSAQSSHPVAAQLAAFAQGKLAAAERSALQAHLKECPACRQALPAAGESGSGRDILATTDAPPSGAAATHHPDGDVPADLANHPRYEVLQLLGQGGMGAVYKARHKKMDRFVALKVINAKLLDNPKAVERFQREVQAAAKLDHPNIIRAFDADEAGGTHFLVMEFVEGTDLAKYVEKKGPLPVGHACHFIRQAALGLEHAHQHGMVHRDIKPHNLMLASPAASAPRVVTVKVMDFGLARLARDTASEAGLTGENALMGTADYIAPEQAEDARKADIRADIYSLGCSLFHLLAGRPLLTGVNVTRKLSAHLTGKLPLGELPASVPAELRTVLAKMVAKDPAQRYQTPVEVAVALVPFIKKAPGVKPPPASASALPAGERTDRTIAPEPSAPARRVRKKIPRRRPLPLRIGGGMLAAVLLAGVVVLWASRGRRPTVEPHPGLTNGETVKQPATLPPTFKNSLGMEFVLVPKGKSWLNGGGGAPGDKEVKIAHDFYLGKYEVTQGDWGKVLGSRPSHFGRAGAGQEVVKDITDEELREFPVETVSWDDAQLFLAALNKREKEPGWTYRLPKETEWEYACRGGPMSDRLDSTFNYYFEKGMDQLLPNQANFEYGERSLKRTCKVGSYKPNRLGLYDMHGNVWEWCDNEQKDANGASLRVNRGGAWDGGTGDSRAASRIARLPSIGFIILGVRLARVPVGK